MSESMVALISFRKPPEMHVRIDKALPFLFWCQRMCNATLPSTVFRRTVAPTVSEQLGPLFYIRSAACAAVLIVQAVLLTSVCNAQWQRTTVRQLDGDNQALVLPAQRQTVSERWNRVAVVPYIVYMPEKDRVLMLVSRDTPHHAATLSSDDHGATWSTPRYVQVSTDGKPGDKSGMATGLTCLGGGRLLLHMGTRHWFSGDYGNSWGNPRQIPRSSAGKPWHEWDPLLVDRDPVTGAVTQLMSFSSDHPTPDGYFQGHVRFSSDTGRSWSGEIRVPEWHRVNEVAFLRAADGNIVAACRTDNPDRFKDRIDHYGGLAVSTSTDDGQTWSELDVLYEHGRHHPSIVLMSDGQIVMTYVVRVGYPKDAEGFAQFGIEAVVSRDNGRTWDMSHRYLLARWSANNKGDNYWWASCQGTSNVLLPDGTILTAFGTGYRVNFLSRPATFAPRDVGLIRWRL